MPRVFYLIEAQCDDNQISIFCHTLVIYRSSANLSVNNLQRSTQLALTRFDLGTKFLDHTKNKLQSTIELFCGNGQRWCDTNGILCE